MSPSPERRRMTLYFWMITAVILLGLFSLWFFFRHVEYTDDAYVEGNQVYITPLHPGFVTAIHTDDTFLVKRGQLLIELDRTDASIALEMAKEQLGELVRQVCEQFHQVFVYEAEIEVKTAELIRDAQDYLHRCGVFKEGGVSIEDYEHAIAALRAQYSSLEMSCVLYNQALAAVQGTSIDAHPRVLAAAERVRDTWVALYRCNIYSPVEGLAAQRTIQVGMWIPSGQPLMSVLPLDQIWVNANYKETQLKSMRIGQKVKITADLWGLSRIFHGTIVGLPGGAGNIFSLLPPQNLSGNWIKIVQRLPVRVALEPDELKQYPLRYGLTCRAFVDTKDQSGELIPTTTVGSPLYATSIFTQEEQGDQECIAQVIAANLDPALAEYAHCPLALQSRTTTLPPFLQEAFAQEAHFQKQLEFHMPESRPQEMPTNCMQDLSPRCQ